MYKRVLIKISGEALSSASSPLCADTIRKTAESLAEIQRLGVEIGIVVGGGNILRGRSAEGMDRNRADNMGMLATAINALSLQDALEKIGAPCAVLSAVQMDKFCDLFTSRDAEKHLRAGELVIFACGTGSPFFSTDTAAALRAAEIHADVLLLAKNVDAIYSDDPKLNPEAVRYSHLSYDQVIRDNLHATDLTAITLCREQNVPIHVFSLSQLKDVFSGKETGTVVSTAADAANQCIN